MNQKEIKTDVLVVGGGGAGFRAAIGAREKGVDTLLLSKGPLGRCGATPMAGADYTLDGRSLRELGFYGEPKDSKQTFFEDIVKQGFYLNNQKLLEQYVSTAPDRLRELLEWGVAPVRSEERAIFTTGIGMMDALIGQAKKMGVRTLEDVMLLELITQDSQVVGALGLDIASGQFLRFKAKAVVIASGGWHKAFWPNTGMRDLAGDGTAMALRAGAELGNMEFITFCCNVLYGPPHVLGSIASYIFSLRCPGELTNQAGECFLEQYDANMVHIGTHMEWNKCFVSHTSMKEVRAGKGSPKGGIYYGRGDLPFEKWASLVQVSFPNWKYKHIDLKDIVARIEQGNPIEVGPAVEYFDGGIVIDHKFSTNLPGLFAAGECTLGPFGANRVCAATTEMLVHGAAAGESAGEYAQAAPETDPIEGSFKQLEEKACAPLQRKDGLKVAQVRRRVQEMAHKLLGPIRTESELQELLSFLYEVKTDQLPSLATASKSRNYNKEWVDSLELANLLQLLETSTKSALLRTESRGVHYREDHPYTDNDNWLKETVAKLNGEITISTRPVQITSLAPDPGRKPYLEMLQEMMEGHSEVGGHH
ncbi:MAG: FAD-binding protein [Deltaproteobacteria bacterium]|nr:FAD-binding protein [Deltaproteobacteria bacterium]